MRNADLFALHNKYMWNTLDLMWNTLVQCFISGFEIIILYLEGSVSLPVLQDKFDCLKELALC